MLCVNRVSDLPEFVLASRSPRRVELLRGAGYRFTVIPPPLHEPPSAEPGISPGQFAEALAFFKASSVHAHHPDRLVVGADTTVALGEEIFGKAVDENDARRILRRLSGARQSVITGLAVLLPGTGDACEAGRRVLASDVTYITMRPMSEGEIGEYIASGEWKDKAGAYAIQETADRFVVAVEGSVSNVVGLPMELVTRMLREVRRGNP
jgi:septum formation protein